MGLGLASDNGCNREYMVNAGLSRYSYNEEVISVVSMAVTHFIVGGNGSLLL